MAGTVDAKNDGQARRPEDPAPRDSSSADTVWKKRAALVLRIILGGIFIYSGGVKVFDPAAFQADVANFQLLSWSLSGFVALYLPWLEIFCGAALLSNKQLHGGSVLLILLTIGFIFFLGSAWARGLDVSCGCFGRSETATNYPLAIARNLLILTGLGAILWLGRRKVLE